MTKTATTPIDVPSRRTVEQLFRDLIGYNSDLQEASSVHADYRRAEGEAESFKKKLLDNKKLKQLEAKEERLRDKWYEIERRFKRRAVELRMIYQSEGLTDRVKKELSKLVEDVRKCR
jgi:hypothetical protein